MGAGNSVLDQKITDEEKQKKDVEEGEIGDIPIPTKSRSGGRIAFLEMENLKNLKKVQDEIAKEKEKSPPKPQQKQLKKESPKPKKKNKAETPPLPEIPKTKNLAPKPKPQPKKAPLNNDEEEAKKKQKKEAREKKKEDEKKALSDTILINPKTGQPLKNQQKGNVTKPSASKNKISESVKINPKSDVVSDEEFAHAYNILDSLMIRVPNKLTSDIPSIKFGLSEQDAAAEKKGNVIGKVAFSGDKAILSKKFPIETEYYKILYGIVGTNESTRLGNKNFVALPPRYNSKIEIKVLSEDPDLQVSDVLSGTGSKNKSGVFKAYKDKIVYKYDGSEEFDATKDFFNFGLFVRKVCVDKEKNKYRVKIYGWLLNGLTISLPFEELDISRPENLERASFNWECIGQVIVPICQACGYMDSKRMENIYNENSYPRNYLLYMNNPYDLVYDHMRGEVVQTKDHWFINSMKMITRDCYPAKFVRPVVENLLIFVNGGLNVEDGNYNKPELPHAIYKIQPNLEKINNVLNNHQSNPKNKKLHNPDTTVSDAFHQFFNTQYDKKQQTNKNAPEKWVVLNVRGVFSTGELLFDIPETKKHTNTKLKPSLENIFVSDIALVNNSIYVSTTKSEYQTPKPVPTKPGATTTTSSTTGSGYYPAGSFTFSPNEPEMRSEIYKRGLIECPPARLNITKSPPASKVVRDPTKLIDRTSYLDWFEDIEDEWINLNIEFRHSAPFLNSNPIELVYNDESKREIDGNSTTKLLFRSTFSDSGKKPGTKQGFTDQIKHLMKMLLTGTEYASSNKVSEFRKTMCNVNCNPVTLFKKHGLCVRSKEYFHQSYFPYKNAHPRIVFYMIREEFALSPENVTGASDEEKNPLRLFKMSDIDWETHEGSRTIHVFLMEENVVPIEIPKHFRENPRFLIIEIGKPRMASWIMKSLANIAYFVAKNDAPVGSVTAQICGEISKTTEKNISHILYPGYRGFSEAVLKLNLDNTSKSDYVDSESTARVPAPIDNRAMFYLSHTIVGTDFHQNSPETVFNLMGGRPKPQLSSDLGPSEVHVFCYPNNPKENRRVAVMLHILMSEGFTPVFVDLNSAHKFVQESRAYESKKFNESINSKGNQHYSKKEYHKKYMGFASLNPESIYTPSKDKKADDFKYRELISLVSSCNVLFIEGFISKHPNDIEYMKYVRAEEKPDKKVEYFPVEKHEKEFHERTKLDILTQAIKFVDNSIKKVGVNIATGESVYHKNTENRIPGRVDIYIKAGDDIPTKNEKELVDPFRADTEGNANVMTKLIDWEFYHKHSDQTSQNSVFFPDSYLEKLPTLHGVDREFQFEDIDDTDSDLDVDKNSDDKTEKEEREKNRKEAQKRADEHEKNLKLIYKPHEYYPDITSRPNALASGYVIENLYSEIANQMQILRKKERMYKKLIKQKRFYKIPKNEGEPKIELTGDALEEERAEMKRSLKKIQEEKERYNIENIYRTRLLDKDLEIVIKSEAQSDNPDDPKNLYWRVSEAGNYDVDSYNFSIGDGFSPFSFRQVFYKKTTDKRVKKYDKEGLDMENKIWKTLNDRQRTPPLITVSGKEQEMEIRSRYIPHIYQYVNFPITITKSIREEMKQRNEKIKQLKMNLQKIDEDALKSRSGSQSMEISELRKRIANFKKEVNPYSKNTATNKELLKKELKILEDILEKREQREKIASEISSLGREISNETHVRKILIEGEYLENGTLTGFIKSRKHMFSNIKHKTRVEDKFLTATNTSSLNESSTGTVYLSKQFAGSVRVLRKHLLQCLNIILDVALGLKFMIASGVAHCDMKPQNIVIGNDGRAKIIDFGSSRFMDKYNQVKGDILCTLEYAPPEVLKSMTSYLYLKLNKEGENPPRYAAVPLEKYEDQITEDADQIDVWSMGIIMADTFFLGVNGVQTILDLNKLYEVGKGILANEGEQKLKKLSHHEVVCGPLRNQIRDFQEETNDSVYGKFIKKYIERSALWNFVVKEDATSDEAVIINQIADVIHSCLHFDATNRISINELVKDIEHILENTEEYFMKPKNTTSAMPDDKKRLPSQKIK